MRTACLLATAVLVLGSACISDDGPFMHVRDRANYAIQSTELQRMRFAISTDVLARDLSRGDSPDSVLIVREGTRGAVLESGETWLRVAFEEGGPGVIFLADPSLEDDGYWLATRVEGREGLTKLRDLDEKILLLGGRALRLIEGADAFLKVDSGDLEDVIDSRRHIEGRDP